MFAMMRYIPNFDDYGINTYGEVWSFKSSKWLKPRKNRHGYLEVCLRKDGRQYSKTIHYLVALTFIPQTLEDIKLGRNHVDHIDGNRQNNHRSNLRWVTHKENCNNPLTRENNSKAMKGNKNAKKRQVIIDNKEYESIKEASEKLDIPYQTIYNRLNSKNYPNYKYKERN